MASKGHSIANAQGFFLKSEVIKETNEEIKVAVAEKMDIIDDFFDKKNKLTKEEKEEFEREMLKKSSIRAIDKCFYDFIYSRI